MTSVQWSVNMYYSATITEKTQLFTVFFSTQEFKWILYRLTIKSNILVTKNSFILNSDLNQMFDH